MENLAENLQPSQCFEIKNCLPDKEKFEIIRQKEVLPYSYVNSLEKFKQEQLPLINNLYDKLRN